PTLLRAPGRQYDLPVKTLLAPVAFMLCFCWPVQSTAAEHWNIGLTPNNTRIEALDIPGPAATSPTVLLIGGIQGKNESVSVVNREAADFESIPPSRREFRLLTIPLANPEAHMLQFPPSGVAYKENAESHVLWRWIGIQAPDLVVIVGPSDFGLA